MSVCCVIVTYNRKELLAECINSILNQTVEVKDIIVVDNNSNDGTEEFLQENKLMDKIIYNKLSENIGGAGGFNYGIKESTKKEYEWVWIMDDDSIPNSTALEELLKANNLIQEENLSFLCSKVIGYNNEEMNIPLISERNSENGYPIWMKYLNESIAEVKAATFVSVLLKSEAIKSVGLPWKEFFLWGDDIEYTLRLNKYFGPGYVVGKSIVVHKRKDAKNLSLKEETNENRINLYRYKYRNDILLNVYSSKLRGLLRNIKQLIYCLEILFLKDKLKYKKFKIAVMGTLDGIFNIKLRRSFKNRGNKIISSYVGD